MDFRIEELRRLIASPEAPRRLHGFLRLEERLADLPPEGVTRLLDLAHADPDRTITEVGRRLSESFEAIQEDRRLPDGGPSVLEASSPGTFPETPPELHGVPAEVLAGAATDLFAPCIEHLESLLLARIGSLVPEAIEAACALRHPEGIPMLEPLAGTPAYAPVVARSLAGWGTQEARTLLQKLASDEGPGQEEALLSLARSRDPGAPILLSLASSSPKTEIRRAAARGLGFFTGPEALGALEALLEDPDRRVQLAAVPSWSRQQDPRVQEVLLEMLRFRTDDDQLRAQVVAELRNHPSEEAQEILIGLLRDPNDRVRANAVEALAVYEYGVQMALRLFQPLTQDPVARVRGNAVLALSLTHPPPATEALLEMFDCYETPIRQAAAYCAGMIQSKRATDRLELMMRTEQSQEVLGTAIRALSRIRGDQAQEILRRFALKKTYGAACVAAINLLADLGQASAVPPLVRLAREAEEADVRAASTRGISRLAAHQGLSYLPRLLADSSPEVVVTAIEGLEESGSLEAIGLLSPLLHHRTPAIRGGAVTALWHLGEFSSIRALRSMLADAAEGTAKAGLKALAAVGCSLRQGPLGRRPLLRQALVESFRRQHPEEAEELLRPPREPPPTPPVTPDPIEIREEQPEIPTEERRAREDETRALELLEETYDRASNSPDAALEALSRSPESGALLQAALRLVLPTGNPEAIRELETWHEGQDEFTLTPGMLLGREAHRRGEMDRAVELRLGVVEAQLELARDLVTEARRALGEDALDEAQAATRLLVAMIQAPPRLHGQLGDHLMARGRFREARLHFLKDLLAFPGEPVPALKLALAAFRSGAHELARQACQAALRRDPEGAAGQRAQRLLEAIPPPPTPRPTRESVGPRISSFVGDPPPPREADVPDESADPDEAETLPGLTVAAPSPED